MNLLAQYENDPSYRKFLIELENFDLNLEVEITEETIQRKENSTVSIILNALGATTYVTRPAGNKTELSFVLHNSSQSADELTELVRGLGNSVGSNNSNLSAINVIEQ